MIGLEYIKQIRKYCDYIETHLLNIEKAMSLVFNKCKDMDFASGDTQLNIMYDVANHDLSKFSQEEFLQYQQNFFPVGETNKEGFASAWQHHKDNNPHHWENWATTDFDDPNEWKRHCVGMVIDWVAMGFYFNDTAEAYYEKNKDRIEIPEEAIMLIHEIFDRLRE